MNEELTDEYYKALKVKLKAFKDENKQIKFCPGLEMAFIISHAITSSGNTLHNNSVRDREWVPADHLVSLINGFLKDPDNKIDPSISGRLLPTE